MNRQEFKAREGLLAELAIRRETVSACEDEVLQRHRPHSIATPSWDFSNGTVRPVNLRAHRIVADI